MDSIKIPIVGQAKRIDDWQERRKCEHYPEGDGTYAVMEDGHVIGIIEVRDKVTEDGCEIFKSIFETPFPPAISASIQETIDNEDVADNYENLMDEIHEIKDTLEYIKHQQQYPESEQLPQRSQVLTGISEGGVLEIIQTLAKK